MAVVSRSASQSPKPPGPAPGPGLPPRPGGLPPPAPTGSLAAIQGSESLPVLGVSPAGWPGVAPPARILLLAFYRLQFTG
mgnify:CR=1 FL=1